ncbi:hypothetical protein [Salinicoccus roseus]|uniref:hypothetical protein n=1 Tax=Salinicoccus roseus TaxID=45670 RepID=UPI002301D38B|nr:hypothetical protein [Salinicoccus roseus]
MKVQIGDTVVYGTDMSWTDVTNPCEVLDKNEGEDGSWLVVDSMGQEWNLKEDDLEVVNTDSEKLDQIKEVMDLPETTYGETFTKLAKIKEIVEGME